MPKARKLPSGSWNCQVYAGDKTEDGKRTQKFISVTVSDPTEDGRIECEKRARKLEKEIQGGTRAETTIADALDRYIASKEKQGISVTTLNAYRSYRSNAFSTILEVPIHKITSDLIQSWINEYSLSHTPKTVSNAIGILIPALRLVLPDRSFSYRLPDRKETDYYTPTNSDVKKLLEVSKGSYLEKAILLSAFGTLRAGEICALTWKDIKGNAVTVDKSLAWDGSTWVLKAPKTRSSVRTVELPPSAIKTILQGSGKPYERVINKSPVAVGDAFRRALDKAGLPRFRFHDLRAYAASSRHAMGIPDVYIMEAGGWKTDAVLKKVYRRAMEDKVKEFSAVSSSAYEDLYTS